MVALSSDGSYVPALRAYSSAIASQIVRPKRNDCANDDPSLAWFDGLQQRDRSIRDFTLAVVEHLRIAAVVDGNDWARQFLTRREQFSASELVARRKDSGNFSNLDGQLHTILLSSAPNSLR